MPKRTDESWRFSNLGTLTLDGFRCPARRHRSDSAIVRIGVPFAAGRSSSPTTALVAPDALAADLAPSAASSSTTLAERPLKHADLLKAHFMAQPQKLGSEKFAALHTAFVGDGAFIYVPAGVELAAPIVVFHYAASGAGAAVFPHTLVIAEENSKVTVVD